MQKNFWLQLILIISLVFVLTACLKLPFSTPADQNVNIKVSDQVQPGEVAVIESDIIVTKPLSNDTISSPLAITGRARVFEGTVLFRLKDGWKQLIASGLTTALVSAPDWGYYSGQLEFEAPLTPVGWLEVYNQNHEDGSDQNLIRLPIIFQEYRRPVVKVYFNNIEGDPELKECDKVYSVERGIDYPTSPLIGAIGELLIGPIEKDKNNGFITNIPEQGVKVQKLEVKDGIAYIDFNQALQEGVGGSCKVTAIRAQITETLKQFDDINEVVISIDGETEDILQP